MLLLTGSFREINRLTVCLKTSNVKVSMDTDMVRERLDELGEELQSVTSLVHVCIQKQQHESLEDADGAFDCGGDATRKFQYRHLEIDLICGSPVATVERLVPLEPGRSRSSPKARHLRTSRSKGGSCRQRLQPTQPVSRSLSLQPGGRGRNPGVTMLCVERSSSVPVASQNLKGEVQTLARVLDTSNGSSLASLTADSLTDVSRLADQAARCKSAIKALDNVCQAEHLLTSSQQLASKNEYVAAAGAVAEAETLLGELQEMEGITDGQAGRGVGKENRRNVAGGNSGVLRALKRLLLKRRAGLESHLRDVINAAVQVGKDGTTVRCRKVLHGYFCERYFRSAVPLSDVFDALGKLGQLGSLFSEISATLRQAVIDHLLRARYVPPLKRSSDDAMASLTYAPAKEAADRRWGSAKAKGDDGIGAEVDKSLLHRPSVDSNANGSADVAELLGRIPVVLQFMHEEVLGGKSHLTQAFGSSLLFGPDGLSNALVAGLEDKIPHSAQDLAAFETKAREACLEFESRLESMGYFGDDGVGLAERHALSRFVDTVDCRFAAKRRRTLLCQARDMALGDYHNSVEVSDALEGSLLVDSSGDGARRGETIRKGESISASPSKVFRLEACQVSTVAKSLVRLVRATLAEACSDMVPAQCARELFRTARDMLDVFRAVIPVHHAHALDGVPRIAAVFQNDCLYLAHHMVTLGHEYRQGLPPPANQTATMIDNVPLFRQLAAQSLSMQQRKQRQQLEEFFAGVDVLASTESSSTLDATLEGILAGEDGEHAKPRGATSAGAGVTGFVMAAEPGDECQAAAAVRKSVYHLRQLKQAWFKVLPNAVYKHVMGSLLSLVAGKICTPVITATDLGEEQTHALHRIFKTLSDATQDIFESPMDAERYSPGWSKTIATGQMMELGLEAIGEMLRGHALDALNADELVGLVRAIFEETPSRASLVAAINHARN